MQLPDDVFRRSSLHQKLVDHHLGLLRQRADRDGVPHFEDEWFEVARQPAVLRIGVHVRQQRRLDRDLRETFRQRIDFQRQTALQASGDVHPGVVVEHAVHAEVRLVEFVRTTDLIRRDNAATKILHDHGLCAEHHGLVELSATAGHVVVHFRDAELVEHPVRWFVSIGALREKTFGRPSRERQNFSVG